MTGHHPRAETLPADVQALLPRQPRRTPRGEVLADEVPPEGVDAAFRLFRAALRPLEEAGKLGYVLFQFAPWVHFEDRWLEYLAGLPARLPGWTLAVELRHRSWFPDHADETLRALRAARLAHVVTDAPGGGRRDAARDGGDRADRGHAAARTQRRGLAAPAARRGAGGAREVRLSLLRSRSWPRCCPSSGRWPRTARKSSSRSTTTTATIPVRNALMLKRLLGQPTREVSFPRRPVRPEYSDRMATVGAADPAHRARAGADAAAEARAPVGRARPGAVAQARRLHRPARDRQQDPQARVPGRRRAGPGRRHPHHLRHAAVELLPGGGGGLGSAGAARGARPQG